MDSELYPHLVRFDASTLAGQFILAANGGTSDAPQRWTLEKVGSWTLAAHPTLRRADVVGERGERLGWLLGEAVDVDGHLIGRELRLETALGWDEAYEQIAGRLTGRFLLIVVAGPQPRVYTDAFSMLAAVYAPELGLVASTSSLVPVTKATAFDVPRILAVGAPYTNGMYPLGLTPRAGIERVLPNHFLDLSQWRLVRRWPYTSLSADGDPAATQKRVGLLASRAIQGLAEEYLLQCPLTAGRDSRLLLACFAAVIDRVTFYTAAFRGEYVGYRDVLVAKLIARSVGLQHSVLRHRRASAADLREWVARTGGEAGELRGWSNIKTFQQVDPKRLMLNGWAGDVVRPNYWQYAQASDQISPEKILSICHVPNRKEFVERAERWLAALPSNSAITTLDLLLIEQRGGCWAGVIGYGLDGFARGNVAPLCNQEIVRSLVALPEAYRRSCTFERDVIAREWPALAEIPFNEQVPATSVAARYYKARDRIRRIATNARTRSRADVGSRAESFQAHTIGADSAGSALGQDRTCVTAASAELAFVTIASCAADNGPFGLPRRRKRALSRRCCRE